VRIKSHRGSSLVFLGFSIIVFIVSYGLLFYLAPVILGSFQSAVNKITITDPAWAATNAQTQATLQYLVPLIPSLGIFVLVLKVLMVASARGRD